MKLPFVCAMFACAKCFVNAEYWFRTKFILLLNNLHVVDS